MSELKPCPFCGGKARPFELTWHAGQFGAHMFEKPYWQVICGECKAAIGDFNSKAEAIATWNARAERTCYADEVTHRDCKYSVNRGWKERTCKQEERGWGTEGDHARVWLTCGHDCMVPTVQDLPNYCPNCGAKVVGE